MQVTDSDDSCDDDEESVEVTMKRELEAAHEESEKLVFKDSTGAPLVGKHTDRCKGLRKFRVPEVNFRSLQKLHTIVVDQIQESRMVQWGDGVGGEDLRRRGYAYLPGYDIPNKLELAGVSLS